MPPPSYRMTDRIALEDPYLREFAALGVGLHGGEWTLNGDIFWLPQFPDAWNPLYNSFHAVEIATRGGFHVGTTWLTDEQVQVVVHVPGRQIAAIVLTGRQPHQTFRDAITMTAAQLYLREKSLRE